MTPVGLSLAFALVPAAVLAVAWLLDRWGRQ